MERQKLIPFLSFTGNAEEAMNYCSGVLPGAKIEALTYFEADAPNSDPGTIQNGVLSFAGQQIMFMDMARAYPAPPFSWAQSFYVECKDEAEFDAVFAGLSDGGSVMMGPEPVMQFRKVAWVTDKFGVTWQPVWE